MMNKTHIEQDNGVVILSKEHGHYFYNGESIELKKNQILLINSDRAPPLNSRFCFFYLNKPVVKCFLNFISSDYDECRYNYSKIPKYFISNCVTPSIFEEAARLSWEDTSQGNRDKKNALVCYILSFFLEHNKIINFFYNLLRNTISDDVYRLISKSPHEKWSLKKAANFFSMSESTLKKTLRRDGATYTEILITCRMHHAKRLLAEGGRNIEDIAFKCGYTNTSYFIFTFHQFYGITPFKYSASLRGES